MEFHNDVMHVTGVQTRFVKFVDADFVLYCCVGDWEPAQTVKLKTGFGWGDLKATILHFI